MSNKYVSVLILIGCLIVLVKSEEASTGGVDVETALLNTIRRGRLAELLLKQRHAYDDNDIDNDVSAAAGSNSDEDSGLIEKRAPKWRTGESRNRFRLLHNEHTVNSNHNNNNQADTKAWEKNLAEKNRMYQNLLAIRNYRPQSQPATDGQQFIQSKPSVGLKRYTTGGSRARYLY